MPARWDTDTRGRGVGDATQLVPGAHELISAFERPHWVAEDPELHLRPHVEAWCAADGRLSLVGAHSDDLHAYALELEWRGSPAAGKGAVRAAVFSLIGSFAESATYVRQRRDGSGLRFEVGTGELADGRYESHGHVVLIDVSQPSERP